DLRRSASVLRARSSGAAPFASSACSRAYRCCRAFGVIGRRRWSDRGPNRSAGEKCRREPRPLQVRCRLAKDVVGDIEHNAGSDHRQHGVMVHTHPVIADGRPAQAAVAVVRDHIRALVVAVANRRRAIDDPGRRHSAEVAMIVPTPVAAIVVPTAIVAMVIVPAILMLRTRRLAVILRPAIALTGHGSAGEQRNQKNPNSSAFHKVLLESSTVVQRGARAWCAAAESRLNAPFRFVQKTAWQAFLMYRARGEASREADGNARSRRRSRIVDVVRCAQFPRSRLALATHV